VKVGGVWKLVSAEFVKVGGSWKNVTTNYGKVGGSLYPLVLYNFGRERRVHRTDCIPWMEKAISLPAGRYTAGELRYDVACDDQGNSYWACSSGIYKVDPDGNIKWTYSGHGTAVRSIAVEPGGGECRRSLGLFR